MANLRFATAMQRLIPFLGYHHVLMIIQIIVIILLSILLAGCSSYSTMTNIYILSLAYTNSTPSGLSSIEKNIADTLNGFKGPAQLEVRAGYFGMCMRQRGILWLCSSDADGLAQQIGSENDPLNLLGMASKFRNDVLFSGLLFMAIILAFISIILLSTFPGWHEERGGAAIGSIYGMIADTQSNELTDFVPPILDERTGSDVDVKPFPSRPVSEVALSCSGVGALLCLVASLWQHVGAVGAAAMAETANYGNVKTDIGTGAMAMAWVGFTLLTIAAIGLLVMILSIIVLDRLTDDD